MIVKYKDTSIPLQFQKDGNDFSSGIPFETVA